MPMRLDEGWNQIQFNLSDFTRRAYGTNYVETLRVQIHANCRIRRIYFSDRLYSEEELPPEFKLFIPTTPATRKGNVSTADGNNQSSVEMLGSNEPNESNEPTPHSAENEINEMNENEIVDSPPTDPPQQVVAVSSS